MKASHVGIAVVLVLAGCGGGLPRGTFEVEEGALCLYQDDTTSEEHRLSVEGTVRIIEPSGDANVDGCTDVVQLSTGRTCEMCVVVDETGGYELVARHAPGTVASIPDCIVSDRFTSLEGTELFESSIHLLPDGGLGIFISYVSTIREGSTEVGTGGVQCNFNAYAD